MPVATKINARRHTRAKAGKIQDKSMPNPKAVRPNPKKHFMALIDIPLSCCLISVYVDFVNVLMNVKK